ncbi:hypothetical protein MBLNU459_g1916t1 [Dothideomycetes sp. NU459]
MARTITTQGSHSHGSGSKGLGKGLGKTDMKRHRKILRDNIQSVTKGSIRRMARRGGVKRISADIYPQIRIALKERLTEILKQTTALVEHLKRKTITVPDIVYVLNRMGKPIYVRFTVTLLNFKYAKIEQGFEAVR